jgi:hypothetical protein
VQGTALAIKLVAYVVLFRIKIGIFTVLRGASVARIMLLFIGVVA